MSSLSQSNNIDYSLFGGEKAEENEPKIDYSSFGGEKIGSQEKVGKAKSIMYGAVEGLLGLPALIQYGVNEWSKALETGEPVKATFEEENPLLSTISKLPESETQTGRRLRAGTSGMVAGSLGGIPGIIGGLVGSQAGQTIRELYGKEGKFEEFGLGEVGAITADLISGGLAGVGTSLARGSRAAVRGAPLIFEQGETALERASIRSVIQGEKEALNNIVEGFGRNQIQGFNNRISNISSNRYSDLADANVASLQRNAQNLYRENNLQLISPLNVTPEQGGQAIQQSANQVFQRSVINAEREAYTSARNEAKNLTGSTPKTVEEAKNLRNRLTSTDPSPEQNPLINWLDSLIEDLEVTTPQRTVPASNLVGPQGAPLIAEQTIEAATVPRMRSANDLIDIIQKGNQAVDYGSELRKQSHRLIPIMNTLRSEVGQILNQNPQAANLYRNANTLHARNAETWGTKYMRSVRFTENPETLVNKTSQASNMRNLKQAIPDPAIQGIAERLVVEKIANTGASSSNLRALNNISPELSLNARNSAQNLINVKDPLTSLGGRAQVRNEILKDAAQSVNTGKRPEKIMKLMETPKGYRIVEESLSASPQGREIFNSLQRLFVEDIFNSVMDSSGRIDFSKATNIFKNRDVRQVAENIGGRNLTNSFDYLQNFANNFERNQSLYSTSQAQSYFKSVFKSTRDASIMGTLMHAIHVPWPVIVGLGLGKVGKSALKPAYNYLEKIILNNPNLINLLGSISKANTIKELEKQVPRLSSEISKTSFSE